MAGISSCTRLLFNGAVYHAVTMHVACKFCLIASDGSAKLPARREMQPASQVPSSPVYAFGITAVPVSLIIQSHRLIHCSGHLPSRYHAHYSPPTDLYPVNLNTELLFSSSIWALFDEGSTI
ncbi:hypothetical protein SCLCIDRAFT_874828 [Scleroderma citrinum Foug A]|uniref:Uncharacterized protein n=1 Tax=Scleroderma citrinum Foug A TaxID=1036808 RepID=A0A0C3A9F6_9AGAM|nr:hypothetical protein SCLCIDRAFT_874828 [Scleroderma citrinum Foug A]